MNSMSRIAIPAHRAVGLRLDIHHVSTSVGGTEVEALANGMHVE